MKTRTKRILLVACVALCVHVLLGVGVLNYFCIELSGENLLGETQEIRSSQRADMIECLLEWVRAAPLPESAEGVSVTKGGSIFTRELRVTFTAPAADIEDWLRRSPGVQNAVVKALSHGIRHFQIEAGGGASFAEITVDDTQQFVTIRGYWS